MPPRALSEEDIAAIVIALKKTMATCELQCGLNIQEVVTLQKLVRMFDHAANIVGKAILYGGLAIIGALLTKGFWAQIASGGK